MTGENRADLPEKKADWHRNCAFRYLAREPRHDRLRGQAGGDGNPLPQYLTGSTLSRLRRRSPSGRACGLASTRAGPLCSSS
jgi:hypothetical protein